jgi:hypothetical protein
MKTHHKRLGILVLLMALFLCGFNLPEEIEKNKVVVEAFDEKGQFLRSGLGFVWDEATIVCSYRNVQGASLIKVLLNGLKSYTNRLISFNDLFDLAVLKAEEEMPEASPLGSSDMVASGDTIYFLVREKTKWQVREAMVEGWTDTGKGYEMIRLQTTPASEPSPLYNSSGKIVGWFPTGSLGIPLEAIGSFVSKKTSTVSLAEVKDPSRIWALKLIPEHPEAAAKWESPEMKSVSGNVQFPFQVDVPKHWQQQRVALSDKFLLRVFEENFGFCVELRILPPRSDDLPSAIERAETLLFSNLGRSNLVPFSARHLTGFRAAYEAMDPEAKYSLGVFYTMSRKYLYVLSLIYPPKYQEEAEILFDQIVSSLGH